MFSSRGCLLRRCSHIVLIGLLVISQIIWPSSVSAQALSYPSAFQLPSTHTILSTTTAVNPPLIQGMRLDPQRPFVFDFYVHKGSGDLIQQDEVLRNTTMDMVKYFLAALTIPNDEMWVNLSPYEEDRMLSPRLGQTLLGRDMLAQDYLLKQVTASLMYPDKKLGRAFWDRVHTQMYRQFGVTDVPVNTFKKVWIVPDRAEVLEQGAAAYVVDRHLKVMLEDDYVALLESRNKQRASDLVAPSSQKAIDQTTKQAIKEVLLPALEREVNEGQTFAQLRQLYNAMILATWYKQRLKSHVLHQVYVNQGKTAGVDFNDPAVVERIYQRYVTLFQDGVYDMIREEYDPRTDEVIPRRYVSGGLIAPEEVTVARDPAQLSDQGRAGWAALNSAGDSAMAGFQVALTDQEIEKRRLSVRALSDDVAIDFIREELMNLPTSFDDAAWQEQMKAWQASDYFFDAVEAFHDKGVVLERDRELWLITAENPETTSVEYQSIQKNNSDDVVATEVIPETAFRLTRIKKSPFAQGVLRRLQLIRRTDQQVFDFSALRGPEAEEMGHGLDYAREEVQNYPFTMYLTEFVSRLSEQYTVDENGQKTLLFMNDSIRNNNDLFRAASVVVEFLKDNQDLSVDEAYERLSNYGLERGWGDTTEEIIRRLSMFINAVTAVDKEEKFSQLSALDRLMPTQRSAVLVSWHGWFVLENAFGKPDTGGQVTYVLDQADELSKTMAEKMKNSGVPGQAVVMIATRLIPESADTTADQPDEVVIDSQEEQRTVRIVRAPVDALEGVTFNNPFAQATDVKTENEWITRFEVWPYIMRESYIRKLKETIETTLNKYGMAKPDILMGNYSDGNYLAVKLGEIFDAPVGVIAHALELSKYFKEDLEDGVISDWVGEDVGELLALQALIDATWQGEADFVFTSSFQEVLGQYGDYDAFAFDGLYEAQNGISTHDAKIIVNPPGVDEDFFFSYDGANDPRRQDFAEERAVWEDRIGSDPTTVDGVYSGFADWQDRDKPMIWTMARFDQIKNIEGLVKEFGLSNLKEKANLTIIGGDTDNFDAMNREEQRIAKAIMGMVKEYDLDGHIRWISASKIKRQTAELYRFMAEQPKGAIFAQPALFEGLGLTVIEAMRTKNLVVATNQGGPSEIVQPGTGLLANPKQEGKFGEALQSALSILADINLRDQYFAQAIKRADANYSWSSHVNVLMEMAKLKDMKRSMDDKLYPAKANQLALHKKQLDDQLRTFADGIDYPHMLKNQDSAMQTMTRPATTGGIDFDDSLMNLTIQRDAQGQPLPAAQEVLEGIRIDGLFPVLLNTYPVNPSLLLGDTAQGESAIVASR